MKTNNKFDDPIFEPLNKLIEEFIPKDLQKWANDKFSNFGIYIPAANIVETATDYELEMTAPGRSKKEFSIKYAEGKLVISADKKEFPALDPKDSYMRKEFAYPEINRRFFFPKNTIKIEGIKASYKNGILKLVLPKLGEGKFSMGRAIKVD